MNGCHWHINPFAMEGEQGQCEKEPAPEVVFRRKHDGYVKLGRRCEEHRDLCNDQWEVVPSV